MTLGIDKINFYIPEYYVDMAKLAEARQIDPNKFLIGIGQTEMVVNPVNQDIVSMGANAAKDIITDEDRKKIGMVIVATESVVDVTKTATVQIHNLLGIQPFARRFEIKEVCYAATPAVQLARDYLATRPDEEVLVIATDTACYGLNSDGEPTQGADAAAVAISHNPSISALNEDAVAYTEDAYDFWRPTGHKCPLVDGALSKDAYIRSFQQSWNEYAERQGKSLADFASLCFHVPFTKMDKKALELTIDNADEATQECLRSGYEDAVDYNHYVGNIYIGSLYLSLISLLENHDLQAGEIIGLLSYGSGSVDEFCSATLVEDYKDHLGQATHKALLSNRTEVSVDVYETFFKRFGDVDFDEQQDAVHEDRHIFYLSNTENNVRKYHRPE